jgi:hypothetical protein
MNFPGYTMLRLMEWIAERLDFKLDLSDDRIVHPLDEQEVTEQLQFGRD